MLPVSQPCTTTVGLSQTRGPNVGSSGEDEELEEKEWKEEVTAFLFPFDFPHKHKGACQKWNQKPH